MQRRFYSERQMSWEIKILSGGQTGADRAALDFALENNIAYGGWCPKGRMAEDGTLDAKYLLRETPSDNYLERTEWNVRDSDATVVFTRSEKVTGGSKQTMAFARKLKKPCLHLHQGLLAVSEKLILFIEKHHVRRLNVAGSRESEEPGIYAWVRKELGTTKAVIESSSWGLRAAHRRP
jgi:hypothetical protein